jgi:SAM-dependent methyltransferase
MEHHLDRARALSYGSVATLYDRYRPTYPVALVDDLIARRPADVLDVGCGTGQVARAFLRRGVAVLGIEPDAQMAAVGSRHGVPIEISTLEAWNDEGRQFDLVTSGASWHWIDPTLGLAKVARLLRPGGTLARFFSYEVPDEPVRSTLHSIYERLAPKATRYVPPPPTDWADPVDHDASFTLVETKTYRWSRALDADEWVGMVTTFSDHQRLEPQQLAALQEALRDAIAALGGTVHVTCGTFVRLARRI